MTHTIRPQDLIDSTVVDAQGSKIGKVGTVYLADDTHEPEWVTVKTGMFGHKETFVPLSGANIDQDGLHVRVAKDQVSDAPQMEAEGHLSQEESSHLYQYYGMPVPRSGNQEDAANSGRRRADEQMDTAAGTGMAAGRTGKPADPRAGKAAADDREMQAMAGKHAGTGRDTDDNTLIRSEERLRVNTEQVETGRVHLRKYVVTEQQQVTVPVSHEEVRIEREPITEADRGRKMEIGEAEQDVVLHAEKPVVTKETVPVEKVRLGTERVTEEQTVTDNVRKEQIDIDQDRKRK